MVGRGRLQRTPKPEQAGVGIEEQAGAQVMVAAGAGHHRDCCGVRRYEVGHCWLQPAVRSSEIGGFESALVAGSEGVAAAGYEIL